MQMLSDSLSVSHRGSTDVKHNCKEHEDPDIARYRQIVEMLHENGRNNPAQMTFQDMKRALQKELGNQAGKYSFEEVKQMLQADKNKSSTWITSTTGLQDNRKAENVGHSDVSTIPNEKPLYLLIGFITALFWVTLMNPCKSMQKPPLPVKCN